MTFDQYSKCGFGCLYCFSQYQKAVGPARRHYIGGDVSNADVERVKRIFTEPESSQFCDYVQARMMMQWGGLADPFCPIERERGVGLELMRFLRERDYPVSFSTKSTWWLDDARYTELFKDNPNWHLKFSIITLDAEKARALERGCPSPQERLHAMKRLAAIGCGGVTLRLRPFIVGITTPTHLDLIRAAGAAGAVSMSTEFFCLEMRSKTLRRRLSDMSKLAGFNLIAFYKKHSYGSGYLRLNRNVKRKFVDEMQATAHTNGLSFYVSDAHFKERCDGDCCCGVPERLPFSRGQFTRALRLARTTGRVRWADIEAPMAYMKGFLWRKAIGYNTMSSEKRSLLMTMTMYEYLRFLWNTPTVGQGPYQMFEGILRPAELDEDGNLIYEYDNSHG